MVQINANMDMKTHGIIRTGRLNDHLYDLFDDPLYITFVARKEFFFKEAWQEDGDTFLRVVLPYEEVLNTDNIDLLIMQELYEQLDLIRWFGAEKIKLMKMRLKEKMKAITIENA